MIIMTGPLNIWRRLQFNTDQIRKEDILKRANERRQEIQEELNTVKRRLRETTIEQAALTHLTRKLDAESDSVSDVEGNGR